MKGSTTSAAVLGLLGGAAIGIWVGAELATGPTLAHASAAVVRPVETSAPELVKSPLRRSRVSRVAPSSAVTPAGDAPKLVMTLPVSAPELHSRMKPVLARGTKIPLAVEGFKDAEQFATLAHAARITQVPFVLLKHRVLVEGQSLEAAIRASKPGIDVEMAAARARAEARNDIAAVSGQALSN